MAVLPERSRLVVQRQLGDPLGEFGMVEIAGIDICGRIGLADQAVAIEAVGDAGGLRIRSRMVSGRFGGTSSSVLLPSSAFFSTPTFTLAKEGMYFETGSSSLILPSSISIIATTR